MNSTRLELRTRMKEFLNVNDDDFWPTATFNKIIQSSFNKYFRRWQTLNIRFGAKQHDMTYAGSLDSELICYGRLNVVAGSAFIPGDIITGGTSAATAKVYKTSATQLWVNEVNGTFVVETITGSLSSASTTVAATKMTNITGTNTGEMLSLVSVHYLDGTVYVPLTEDSSIIDVVQGTTQVGEGRVESFFVHQNFTTSTGGISLVYPSIYLRPIPASSVTLRLYIKAEPHTLSADTSTTGLPDAAEDCILYDALIHSRLVEENTAQMKVLNELLGKAELELRKYKSRFVAGQDRIIIRDYDLY